MPHIARVRHLNDKLKPDHWRVPELLQRRATLWCGQEQFHGELHEGCLERLGMRCVPSITQACATDSTGIGFRCC
jgi:hypothetical protein